MNLPYSVVQLCVIRTIVQRNSNITKRPSELLQVFPILDVFSTELSGIIDIENTASLVVDKFFDSYLLKEKRKPNKNVSLFSRESLNRWLEKQEQVTIGQLADFDFVDLPAVDQYRHMRFWKWCVAVSPPTNESES